jgi:hypothetical protein
MGVSGVESGSAVTSLARAYDSTLAATAGGGGSRPRSVVWNEA